jgi:hypothetical protein
MEKPEEKIPDPAKKPYKKPVLELWGTLREMTEKVGRHGSADGGKSRKHSKTKP